MDLRFRKSLRIAPGFSDNVGTKSLSSSSEQGIERAVDTSELKRTAGVPGTGLSNIGKLDAKRRSRIASDSANDGSGILGGLIALCLVGEMIYMMLQAF